MFRYLKHLQDHKMNPVPTSAEEFERRNYNALTEDDRVSMKVDEIFAFYLYNVALKVKEEFYTETMLPYVILFRECLDDIGW